MPAVVDAATEAAAERGDSQRLLDLAPHATLSGCCFSLAVDHHTAD
jgi:hypothetical protein